jgi:hypothetical protein
MGVEQNGFLINGAGRALASSSTGHRLAVRGRQRRLVAGAGSKRGPVDDGLAAAREGGLAVAVGAKQDPWPSSFVRAEHACSSWRTTSSSALASRLVLPSTLIATEDESFTPACPPSTRYVGIRVLDADAEVRMRVLYRPVADHVAIADATVLASSTGTAELKQESEDRPPRSTILDPPIAVASLYPSVTRYPNRGTTGGGMHPRWR